MALIPAHQATPAVTLDPAGVMGCGKGMGPPGTGCAGHMLLLSSRRGERGERQLMHLAAHARGWGIKAQVFNSQPLHLCEALRT